MNIFVVDSSPVRAAQALCNSHVVKMILESAQLLCTVHSQYPAADPPEKFYKPTHKNHPCTKWVAECTGNYRWLTEHAVALCHEYTHRYGKVHASTPVIEWCCRNYPNIREDEFCTPPAQAMPDEYKDGDVITAYRNYYREVKLKTIKCEWTNRERPSWL